MTIKEKVIEAWSMIDVKLKISSLKFHYLTLGLILLAIPLTVISVQHQTSNSIRAQARSVNVLTGQESFIIPAKNLEDDQETYIAPVDMSAANTIKSNDLVNDQKILDTTVTAQASSLKKPNIVFILIDDMPYLDDRIFSRLSTIKNLFIDHGVRFTNSYGESPLCCPGRAGYLTGQHTSNHGVTQNDANLFNPSMTIATQLKKAGYYTFLSGKYFNGFNAKKQSTPGWDDFSGYGGAYYNYYLWNNGRHVYYDTDYSTDVIAKKSIVYLKKAPTDKPIFGYITPYAVHEDHGGAREPGVAAKYVGDPRCQNIPNWKNANYNEEDMSDKPNYVRGSKVDQINGWPLTKSCEALLSVDDVVRKVKNELQAQGRLDNTVFILGADNGMDWGAHGHYGKVWPYTGQVNFFVYWPKTLGTTPYTISETVQNIDVAPTLCEIGGCKMGPYPNGQANPDGKSFLSLLKRQTNNMGRDVILEAMKGNGGQTYNALYTTAQSSLGLWHYVEYASGEKELYDLSHGPCYLWNFSMGGDPCELDNLLRSDQTPSSGSVTVARQLASRLKLLKAQKGKPIPAPVASYTR